MSDTTHEAPERIWIQTDHIPDQCALDKWHVQPDANEASLFTDYVRADIHADRIEELEAKLAKAVVALVVIDALNPEGLIDGCSQLALRGLVLRMGETARATLEELKGKADE